MTYDYHAGVAKKLLNPFGTDTSDAQVHATLAVAATQADLVKEFQRIAGSVAELVEQFRQQAALAEPEPMRQVVPEQPRASWWRRPVSR